MSVRAVCVCVCACVRVFSDIDDDNSPIYTAKRAGYTDPQFNQRVPGAKQQFSGEQNMNVCGVCVRACVCACVCVYVCVCVRLCEKQIFLFVQPRLPQL